jgi:hypothetical protein
MSYTTKGFRPVVRFLPLHRILQVLVQNIQQVELLLRRPISVTIGVKLKIAKNAIVYKTIAEKKNFIGVPG